MNAVHEAPHPLSGKTVNINIDGIGVGEYTIEDYWDRVHSAGSWMFAQGNPAALKYAVRAGVKGLPVDDEVVYGKLRGIGHIVHLSEIPSAAVGAA